MAPRLRQCRRPVNHTGSSSTAAVSFLQEKQKLLDEIEELSLRLSDEQENRRKLGDRLSHERHQFQRDKEATQEVRAAPQAHVGQLPGGGAAPLGLARRPTQRS